MKALYIRKFFSSDRVAIPSGLFVICLILFSPLYAFGQYQQQNEVGSALVLVFWLVLIVCFFIKSFREGFAYEPPID